MGWLWHLMVTLTYFLIPRREAEWGYRNVLRLSVRRVSSISPELLRPFSLNFTQMFLSVRQCAEPMTQLHSLKINVTIQGHKIYSSIFVRSISRQPFELVALIFIQVFFLVGQCAEHMTQPVTQGQDHWSRSRDLSLNLVSVRYLLNPDVGFHETSPTCSS